MTHRLRTWSIVVLALSACSASALAAPGDSDRHYREGLITLKSGHAAQALDLFLKSVKEDPTNDEARFQLGLIELQWGQYRDAESQFAKISPEGVPVAKVAPLLAATRLAEGRYDAVLDVAPCTGNADCKGEILALHAQAHLGMNDLAGADADARAALQATPHGIPALLAHALVLNATGDAAAAEKQVDDLLLVNPKLAQALMLKADLRSQAGDLDGAVVALRKAVAADPHDVRARAELIIALVSGDHDADAAAETEKLLAGAPAPENAPAVPGSSDDAKEIMLQENDRLSAVPPDVIMGRYLKALLLVRAQNLPSALDTIRPVEALVATVIPRSAYLLAVIHAGNNNLEQAAQYAANFNNAFPDNIPGIKLLANLKFRIGAYKSVIDILETRHDRFRDDVAVLTLLGSTYLAEGRIEDANRLFAEAVKVRPDDPLPRARLAVSLTGRRKTREDGIRQLEGLIDTNPASAQIDVALVAAHFANGEYGRAIQAATTMIERQPASPLPLALRGAAEIESGDEKAARGDFEAALAKDQDYVPAALSLAEQDLRGGNSDGARQTLDHLLGRQPANLTALLARADIELRVGEPSAAIPYLRTAIANHPENAQAQIKLLGLLLARGEADQALRLVQDLVRTHPGDVSVIDLAATTCIQLGKPDMGMQLFQDLASRYPNKAEVSWRFGELLVSVGKLDDARQVFSRAVVDAPDYLPAWIDLALVERRLHGLDSAMDVVRKAQAHNSKSDVAALLRGDLLRLGGRLAQAEQAYAEVQASNPSARTLTRIFEVVLQQGDRDRAFGVARAWLADHPDDLVVRLEMAQNDMAEGDVRAAIELYEFAAARAPRDAVVLNNLAWAYDKVGDPRALDTAKRAYFLAPDAATITDTYAYLLYRRGDRKRGAELLRQAYRANPKSPNIAFHMALALAEANDAAQAMTILKPIIDGKQKFDEVDGARQLYATLGGS